MPEGGKPYGNPHPGPDLQKIDARLGLERPTGGLYGKKKPGFDRLLKIAGRAKEVTPKGELQQYEQEKEQKQQEELTRQEQTKEQTHKETEVGKRAISLLNNSYNSGNVAGTIGIHPQATINEGMVRFTDLPKQAQQYFTQMAQARGVQMVHGWDLTQLQPDEAKMLKQLYLMGQREREVEQTRNQLREIAGRKDGV